MDVPDRDSVQRAYMMASHEYAARCLEMPRPERQLELLKKKIAYLGTLLRVIDAREQRLE